MSFDINLVDLINSLYASVLRAVVTVYTTPEICRVCFSGGGCLHSVY